MTIKYMDETSKERLTERAYIRVQDKAVWLSVAEDVIAFKSGSPESYDYILDTVINKQGERFTLAAPTLGKAYGHRDSKVRTHLNNLVRWGVLEVVDQQVVSNRLVYMMTIPVSYRRRLNV